MPELRKDPIIGRWVIIASERGSRPGSDMFREFEPVGGDSCAFCEGQEESTPPEILAFRDDNSEPNAKGWWIRVVPNKYPAMQVEGRVERVGEGMFDMMSGVGAHEVVIETADHHTQMVDMKVQQIEEIIWAYRERMLDLRKDNRFRYVMIFKNHGRRAGATVDHSHSQIIALPIIPKRVLEEIKGTEEYFSYKERCVFCDVIHQEDRDGQRVVDSTDRFIAFHPYAARFAFETWIVPRYHNENFFEIQMDEVSDLARILKDLLLRFRDRLHSPAFNFMIHTAPIVEGKRWRYHWHVEVIPRLTSLAGFEWGTGFYINAVAPETAAQFILGQIDTLNGEDAPEEPAARSVAQ